MDFFKTFCAAALAAFAANLASEARAENGWNGYDVAAFVWPAYHAEPRWAELGIFAHGCGEWQNVYEATPKFEGHREPIEPLWGYEKEDNPVAAARKIDAALAAGINVFIYDWYWYGGRPFLENALNNGFLKAPNCERMRFYIMWANHYVTPLWDNKAGSAQKSKKLWSPLASLEEFRTVIAPRWLKQYFCKPNYYKINNKPVVSIFNFWNFVGGVGGLENAREAIKFLDDECRKAGFAGVHIQPTVYLAKKPPYTLPGKPDCTFAEIFEYLGISSTTVYNWPSLDKIEHLKPYRQWGENSFARFDAVKKLYGVQFFPNVTIGWDNNSRYPKGEMQPVILPNPKDYEHFLRRAKDWADKNIPAGLPKLITINAWNEWTEGNILEPDKKSGYDFLNATARVFGGSGQAK